MPLSLANFLKELIYSPYSKRSPQLDLGTIRGYSGSREAASRYGMEIANSPFGPGKRSAIPSEEDQQQS